MDDELNYKDFYEEEVDLEKPAGVGQSGRFFVWSGIIITGILISVFIFASGGSEVKGAVNSNSSFLGNLITAAEKTFSTIFGTGSSERLVESIDLQEVAVDNPNVRSEHGVGLRNANLKNDGANINREDKKSSSVYRAEEKININTASQTELDRLEGVGPAVAAKIIDYRNINGTFWKIEDIKNVNGIGEVAFDKMKNQITVGNVQAPESIHTPPAPLEQSALQIPVPKLVTEPVPNPTQGKININKAGLQELQEIAGVGPAIAQRIIEYRVNKSLFYKIEDIKEVNGIGDVTFEKMRDQITVGDIKAPPPPAPPTPVPTPAPVPQSIPTASPVPPAVPPAPVPPIPTPPSPVPSEPVSPSPSPESVPETTPPPPAVPPVEPSPAPTPPPAPPEPSPVPPPVPPEPSLVPPSTINHLLISEVMAGTSANASYEFIELYNPTSSAIDLTGWTVKKKTSTGSEPSPFVVASRLQGKIIQPGHYFLLGNDTGYVGSPAADVLWPHSYTLAYTNNTVIVYDPNGNLIDSVLWSEDIKDKSYERENWSSDSFMVQEAPTPTNSQN